MEERLTRIRCPRCGSSYRVDMEAVPPEGATALCKKCGQRFAIEGGRSSSGGISRGGGEQNGAPANSGSGHAATGSSPEPSFTCPACGHRQVQPFNCYACGAVITPREQAPTAPPAPDAAAPATPASHPAAHAAGIAAPFGLGKGMGLGMGAIVVRTRIGQAGWTFRMTKPLISIEGMEHRPDWGVHSFQAPEGECQVVIDCGFPAISRGHASITVKVSVAEKTYIDYIPRAAQGSAEGSVRRASKAEGLLWQVESGGAARPEAKGLYSRKAVIISLIVLGPLGLYQLWKSDAFSTRAKIIITVAVAVATYWLFSRLSMPKLSMPKVDLPLQ
jgi:predicted Zn finger-like uncharacterized protein